VTGNELLKAPDGLWRIWFSLDAPSQYFPLVYTVFRFEYSLWGFHPAGYHWVNIFLHAGNGILAWRLLRRLGVPGAWFAAALFALHPVQVESVAWVTELKNVLMGLFFLSTLLFWVRFLDAPHPGRWGLYALALAAYALALSAKTTASTLPAALILVLWLRRMPITVHRIAEISPFVILALLGGLLAIWWERYHQGTQGVLFTLPWAERGLVAAHAVWFYLGKLLWPARLIFIYPRWNVSLLEPTGYLWLLAAALALGAVLLARRFSGRGVEVALMFFVATLGPTLGFVMLGTFRLSFVADHYQYLACLGPFALCSAGLVRTLEWIGRKRAFPVALAKPLLAAGVLLALGSLTWRQTRDYENNETLYRSIILKNPSCWMAYVDLADLSLQRGEADRAIELCERALRVNSDLPEAHLCFGNALLAKGEPSPAESHFTTALEISRRLGVSFFEAQCHYNLGTLYLHVGLVDKAIASLREALELSPKLAPAQVNLGGALLRKGLAREAISHYEKALALDASNPEPHNDMAAAFLTLGEVEVAIAHYERALGLRPDYLEACCNLAGILSTFPKASVRNGPRALELARRAEKLTAGSNPFVLSVLASSLAESGQYSHALETAKRAQALASAGGQAELAAQLAKAIRLYEAGSPLRGGEGIEIR
jgi:tetratricopeptide (TPR) repeat protein